MADLNAMVSYSGNTLNAGDYQLGQIGNCYIPMPNYWDTHYYYCSTYPSYIIPEKSKIEQAFKIMGRLMEKKIIKDISLQQFIELVNSVAEIL